MKNNKGFTLIELLVVIAIIGLLSTLAVVSLNNARIKARDARRLSDIKQTMTALEMYFTDNNDYPTGNTATAFGSLETGGFMAAVPDNPTPNGLQYTFQACQSDGTVCGIAIADGQRSSYTMTYTLEGGVADIVAGNHCATPAGIDAGTPGGNCVPGTDATTAGN
ncbi:prepilin-type N-terminal cleavage/methylation domain-containing protein [bacterium]|nr:prepilin-type N-terminal cleavage/methylation domain-containing protein [bacterium]